MIATHFTLALLLITALMTVLSCFQGSSVSLQTQVYIISGTFGLVALLLILLLLSLAVSVAK